MTLFALIGPVLLGAAPAAVAAPAAKHPSYDLDNALLPPLPAQPPPVQMRYLPQKNKPPKPDTTYHQVKQCIRSGVGAVSIERKPWAQDALQINQAHQFATGKGQTVAVIDTGVHPHRQFVKNGHERLHGGGDYVTKGGTGLKDCDGHGTEVAGIIGADTGGISGNIGFDGMAPDVDILSIRHTSSNYVWQGPNGQKMTAGNLGTLAQAVMWAVTDPHRPNADKPLAAINISLTACINDSQGVEGNFRKLQAAIHYAVEHGTVVVAAAGNIGRNHQEGCTEQNGVSSPNDLNSVPIPPWFGTDVLSVAAVNANGDPAVFSVAGPWVSVAAPGTNIISLDPAGPNLVNRSIGSPPAPNAAVNNGQQAGGGGDSSQEPLPLQGTSFAAPYVTGLVALVRQKFPWLTARQVMHRIEATAQHPAGSFGRNEQVGYGMIDPVAALTDVVPGEPGPNGAAAPVAQATQLPTNLPAPAGDNWPAVVVALAGAGTGIGLLLLTFFVLHTVQRNRRRTPRQGNSNS